jgi:hypothetical protein
MTLFFRLVTGQECPVFEQSGIQIPGTGKRLNLNTDRDVLLCYNHSDLSHTVSIKFADKRCNGAKAHGPVYRQVR